MSFRDDSSSTFHGGGGYSRSGNPGSNGEVGGGMGGGYGGGGAGRNGGYNSSTGLRTGTTMNSSTQRGRSGGISEELAALFKASQPKTNRPNAARPVTQPPLPTYVEPPPVVEPPLPVYEEVPPEVVPAPVGAAAPKPSFNKYGALRAYQSAYGPEGYAFAGVPGMGMRRAVNSISNSNSRNGYGGGISDAFNDKYGKK